MTEDLPQRLARHALAESNALEDDLLLAAAEIERLRQALREIAAKDKTGYGRAALGHIARTTLRSHHD